MDLREHSRSTGRNKRCIVRGLVRLSLLGCLAGGVLLTGCAPGLSSFTPAHVPPRKHVQAETGFDVAVPSGLGDIIDDGVATAKSASDHELTEAELQTLFRAGAALGLNPPSLVTHVGLGYVPLDHFEVNGRLMSGAWRLGGRYQLLSQAEHGIDGTVSLGGGHYSYEFPLGDRIPLLKLEDFSRWQVDASFLIGRHGSWYRVWGGPRLLQSFYGTELVFEQPSIPSVLEEKRRVLASLDGAGTYLGAQLGAALGYKYVFIGFELTVVKFWTRASVDFFGSQHDIDLKSTVVYPGIALMLEL